MTDDHKSQRVKFAEKILRDYGCKVTLDSPWANIINTDFSAKIKVNDGRNIKMM